MANQSTAPQIRRGLDVIERSANAQQRLIEELDDLSHIAIAAVRMELSIIDLNDIVRSVAAATEPLASERHLVELHGAHFRHTAGGVAAARARS